MWTGSGRRKVLVILHKYLHSIAVHGELPVESKAGRIDNTQTFNFVIPSMPTRLVWENIYLGLSFESFVTGPLTTSKSDIATLHGESRASDDEETVEKSGLKRMFPPINLVATKHITNVNTNGIEVSEWEDMETQIIIQP